MSLVSGTKLGPYEIQVPLGAGGMGEVYRARDTRLQRSVAIKILPAQLSSDPARKQRFEREAKTISSLNHPHICVLYDIGSQDGVDYLVMECVEGETLANRLERGPLPLEQVLKYGAQIADALDKAHRAGIVHRDLKPGNIMLTSSGAKLLDFGLAKPAAPLAFAATLTAAAPQTTPVTEQGTIVGTFQYMSPEQVEGKDVDGRSDVFSLGAVLYEMLTGRRAFEGKSQLSVASAILEKEPEPVSTLKPMTPPALDRAIRRCLAKDREERWQAARDLVFELKWIAEAGSQVGLPASIAKRRPARERLAWALAAVSMLALALLGGWAVSHWREKPAGALTVRFHFGAPEKTSFRIFDAPAVSPDGTRIALSATSSDGQTHLWIRGLDSLSTEMLPGTEGGLFPFWSPDSQSIGFFAAGKLKRIKLSGGPPQTLCDASALTGTWGSNGVILFRGGSAAAIYRVSAAGGEPKPATELDTSQRETVHAFPEFLPDGRHFLYYVASSQPERAGVYLGTLDSKEKKHLLPGGSRARYSWAGYLLFLRGTTLMAQQFDWKRVQLIGDPVPIADHVVGQLGTIPAFSVSQNGVLAYRTSSVGNTELIWFDRHGIRQSKVGPAAEYSSPSLSPDGSRLAIGRIDPRNKTRDLWVFDLARGASSRLTFDPADDLNPVWTHEGSRIFFTSNRKGQRDIYEKPANGIGTEEVVLESSQAKYVNDLSPDGRYLVYDTGGGTVAELWILPLSGDRQPVPFVQGNLHANSAQFSPDGRFIAYASNESGPYEVYVRSFPEQHGKWQISTDGGTDPMWRHDGKELFYISETKLMAVEVKTDGTSLQVGIPKPLFEIPLLLSNPVRNHYVVTPDGQRFLFNVAAEGGEPSMINVVVNWPAELHK